MAAERTCPQCGTILSPDALEGLCPKCVGRAAFDSPSQENAGALAAELSEAEFARLKPEEAGEQIGQYKLMEQIGQGGFGTVWVADQERPVRRRVALKIIKLGMDTREVIARFEQERQALAMMDHPNIAKVFDAGMTEWGRPFFVMELVRGIKITDYCDQANLPTAERLTLFIQVCNAVQHAHQKGIIHRDLKPSNILVTLHDGVPVPKVIDFGVAKATQQVRLTDLTIYTQFQQMIGTPLYMSPEQAEMSGLDIDTRSDIYSLGVLLYELLTGRTPFDAEDLMKQGLDEIRRVIREVEPQTPSMFLKTMADETRIAVAQHRQSDPAKLTNLVRGDLDWIVMKALEKDRNRRYETARGLADDIERHLVSEPVLARPASQSYRFRRLVKRNKLTFAASAAVALALVLGLAGTLWQAHRAAENASAARKSAGEERKANLLAQAEAAKAKAQVREASRSDTATAQQRLADGNWPEAVAYFGRAIRYDSENRNAQEALWLALRYGQGDAERLPLHSLKHKKEVLSATFSPDGTRIVTASADHTAQVWDATTGQPIGAALEHRHSVLTAEFSPDGSRIVTASWDKTARVWDATTGRPIGTDLEHKKGVRIARFSPDGTRIVTASGYSAQVWDATTGRPIGMALEHKRGTVISVSFSPDGKRIVTVSADKTARIWDATTGEPIGEVLKHEGTLSTASFSPDGTRIVTASADKTARIWDATTGEPIGAVLKHDGSVRDASFSPDGTHIVTVTFDSTTQVWDATTGQPIGAALKAGAVESASFSPDGRRIITAGSDMTARLWGTATGQPIGAALKHDGWVKNPIVRLGTGVTDASFSPDGARIVTASTDGTAQVWNVSSGQPKNATLETESPVSSASFSADGTRIVTAGGETVQVWDAATGQPIGAALEHKTGVVTAIFTPDATRIITASRSRIVQVWDARSGQPVGASSEYKGDLKSVRFSTNGARIVTASGNGTMQVHDMTTGDPIGAALKQKGPVSCASFSPDGTRIVTASAESRDDPGSAQVWDVATGQPIGAALEHQSAVVSASFSGDGSRIVTASSDGIARVWNATTGEPVGLAMRAVISPKSASFSPDDSRIVIVGLDGVQIWDPKTGQPIGPALDDHRGVQTATFSPDGKRFATVSAHGIARIWNATTSQRIGADIAESLTAFAAGVRLDSQLGTLEPVSRQERLLLWQKLEPALARLPDWHSAARQPLPLDSPRVNAAIRQAATSLIRILNPDTLREAAAMDPAHPFLPFAFAEMETRKTDPEAANSIRAAWLIDYGMKRLPADTSAADLRFLAHFVVNVAETLPEQKATALSLLDRAARLAPEDDEAKKLRDWLN